MMYGSELVTLFGDELSEIDQGRAGVQVVGGVKVSARDMATMLLAVSVAELLDRGAGALTEQEVKKLFRTGRTLTFRSAEAGEGFTRSVAVAAGEPVAVTQLALRLLGGTVVSPEMMLIAMARAELGSTGAVVPANARTRIGRMLGTPVGEIDDQRAESLRDDWQRLHKLWDRWKGDNPSLADTLVSQCRKAMTEAKDLSD